MEDKLELLIKFIKLNNKYYRGHCPLYEIEHLMKLGYEESVIINRLKENNINIVDRIADLNNWDEETNK